MSDKSLILYGISHLSLATSHLSLAICHLSLVTCHLSLFFERLLKVGN